MCHLCAKIVDFPHSVTFNYLDGYSPMNFQYAYVKYAKWIFQPMELTSMNIPMK